MLDEDEAWTGLGSGLGTASTIGGRLKIARHWTNQDDHWNRYGNANRQLQVPAEAWRYGRMILALSTILLV